MAPETSERRRRREAEKRARKERKTERTRRGRTTSEENGEFSLQGGKKEREKKINQLERWSNALTEVAKSREKGGEVKQYRNKM